MRRRLGATKANMTLQAILNHELLFALEDVQIYGQSLPGRQDLQRATPYF